ncbi:MAG TPA: RNA methyltransferase [Vicinamibacterales bacterium]|nr:RNA methyltransferase [Vicinamibacterales bacterium]HPW20959.1 RNA methyltransferase [Vicinamibacterales bacterium]
MPVIASRHNPFVQRCRALARRRDATSGEILLDGVHLLADALAAGVPIAAAAATRALWERDEGRAIRRSLERAGSRVFDATTAVIEAASPVRAPAGVVAIAQWAPLSLPEVFGAAPALAVCAAGVQDPGNLGAVIRAADAAGATACIAAAGSADPLGWKALRGAMGSAFRVPLVAGADVFTACAEARARGIRVLAAAPGRGRSVFDVDLTGPILFLLGGEGAGLPASVLDLADETLTIPMRAPVESLNVAVAAGVMLFEARRQRHAGLAS